MTAAPSAIPTLYEGIQFRSRLEARYAAFFDLLEIQYEYEPLDLRGYVPDFVVSSCRRRYLAEVKPIALGEPADQHRDRARRAGWEGPIIVLGYEVRETRHCTPHGAGDLTIGRVYLRSGWKNGPDIELPLGVWLDRWDHRWLLAKDTREEHPSRSGGAAARKLWNQAGNIVQWKPTSQVTE